MNNLNEMFLEYLKEDSDYPATYGLPKVGPQDQVPSADDEEKSPHQVTSDPEMLQRVNGWLASLNMRPYINAYSVIVYLRQKLAITGLDFKEPKFEGDQGREVVPCTQWGNPTDLSLTFTWVRVKGWYTISAELQGTPKPSQPIAEDEKLKGEEVEESTNPFALVNTRNNWRKNKIQNMFKRKGSASRVAAWGMRKALTGGAKAGRAIKAAFGTGGYTHNQGRSTHIHTQALRTKTLLGHHSSLKKMTHN